MRVTAGSKRFLVNPNHITIVEDNGGWARVHLTDGSTLGVDQDYDMVTNYLSPRFNTKKMRGKKCQNNSQK